MTLLLATQKVSTTLDARRGKVVGHSQDWWVPWSLKTQKEPAIVRCMILDC